MTEPAPTERSPAGTLVVFCRRPVPGVGKRRLAEDLGDASTAELSALLLATALEDAEAWSGPVVIAPSDPADVDWASGLLARESRVIAQPPSENLGERILAVDRQVRAGGAESVLYVGSDAPLLDDAYFEAARRALAAHDAVLGPAADGGVTLMGARQPWPDDLSRLPWSSDRLGAALERSCRDAGYSVARLEQRSDVDQAEDLVDLAPLLRADERPARRRLLAWLESRSLPISIVVPVRGDLPELQRLLECLGDAAGAEVVVVDGQGDPACGALCRERGCSYLATRPGRGHQLRLGAERATGEILWFLHADAEPPDGAVDAIRAAVRSGAVGGFFQFRFAGSPSCTKRFLELAVALRNRLGGVPYGDQGLFFTRRAYRAAGGFADQPLFEEVPLVRGVRRSREGRFVPLQGAVGVSPRRWEKDGWWRRTLENRMLALAYAAGVPPRILARRYRS